MKVDPTRDALIVVDVQNDFCPGGSLAVPEGDKVVPVLNQLMSRFSALGASIYASRDWHPAETKHFKAFGGPWPPHCVQGTKGAMFHPDLKLPEGVVIISKGMDPEKDSYSAFHGVDPQGVGLAASLRQRGVERVFVGGLATDYCVKFTALDARREGFEVVFLEDASRGVEISHGDTAKAIEEMKAAGVAVALTGDLK